jgi:uncharacterized membrane protein
MVDRTRLAVTKWLPLSSAGAAISFVAGFVLHLAPTQVIISAAMTSTLIFSGLLFQSFGREKEVADATGHAANPADR